MTKPPQRFRSRLIPRPAVVRTRVRAVLPPPVSTFAGTGGLVGYFRVADPTIEGYELYIGTDADPDFTASPAETFTSLPHDVSPLTPGHEYRLALRYRNRWDLQTQNAELTVIDLAGDGSVEPTKPSSAEQLTLTPIVGGKVRVVATYLALVDGDNAASQWLIYLTTDGSTPTPGVTVPIVVDMITTLGWAKLTYDTTALTEGTVVKVLLRTRRPGTPNVDSVSSSVVTATATLIGPSAVSPSDAFLDQSSRLKS